MPPPPPLPTTRQLLTSLITAITNIPLHDNNPPALKTNNNDSSSDENNTKRLKSRRLLHLERQREGGENVLKRVPATHRHLIVTLHVLFPGLVLPALDLLDRGFVGRVLLRGEGKGKYEDGDGVKGVLGEGDRGNGNENTPEVSVKEEDGESTAAGYTRNPEEEDKHKPKPPPSATFYLVRSAQPTHHRARRRRGHGKNSGGEHDEEDINGNNLFPGGQRGYIVRLDAWNCTCAAFAFAAFPVEGEGGVNDSMDVDIDTQPDLSDDISTGREDQQWNFGGMSLENDGSASAPLCKHLLACLLAERWESALGPYVVERHVSREEMAGIVAEI